MQKPLFKDIFIITKEKERNHINEKRKYNKIARCLNMKADFTGVIYI